MADSDVGVSCGEIVGRGTDLKENRDDIVIYSKNDFDNFLVKIPCSGCIAQVSLATGGGLVMLP